MADARALTVGITLFANTKEAERVDAVLDEITGSANQMGKIGSAARDSAKTISSSLGAGVGSMR